MSSFSLHIVIKWKIYCFAVQPLLKALIVVLNQCVSRLICVSGFSPSYAPVLFLSLCYSSLINFMIRKVNCRSTQPCPLSFPRVFTIHTITMQKQSKEHAALTNKNIFVSPRSRCACFKGNLE